MNKYEEQAKKFLADTGTTIEIVKAVPQKPPLWVKKDEEHGINYYVALKNKKGTYGFDFWGSIADAEKIKRGDGHGTKPTAYDILACLTADMGDVSFIEFCDNFGYDNDSIKTQKTYVACVEQSKELHKLFSESELEALSEIQ